MSDPATPLLAQVPDDPWFRVRTAAIATCALGFLWWSRVEGLVTDRISAVCAVAIFVTCAFVGKPWHRWAQVLSGVAMYAAMWFVFEETRGAADHVGMPYQMAAVRNADRVLFLGARPTEWLQRVWYDPGTVQLHDEVLSLVYYSHFVVPVMAIGAAWALGHTTWVRFMRRFASIVLVACLMFVLLPTVPPWMASDPRFGWGVGEPLVRHVRRGVLELGFTGFVHDWGVARDWSNVVAAMPSLHAAFSLFVVVFYGPFVRRTWWRRALYAYPLTMAVALVYFAEHWVVDIVAGWGLVAASFAVWARLERRWRAQATADALAAEPALVPLVGDIATIEARSSRRPPVVVLGPDLLHALADPDAADHVRALDRYAPLLADSVADRVRLLARADHLAVLPRHVRAGVLAPVHAAVVAGQYRRQADRWRPDGIGDDERLTLVTARRERAVALVTLGD